MTKSHFWMNRWKIKKMNENRQKNTVKQTLATLCYLKYVPDGVEELIYRATVQIDLERLRDTIKHLVLVVRPDLPQGHRVIRCRELYLEDWLGIQHLRGRRPLRFQSSELGPENMDSAFSSCEHTKTHIKRGFKGKVVDMIKANLLLQEGLMKGRMVERGPGHYRPDGMWSGRWEHQNGFADWLGDCGPKKRLTMKIDEVRAYNWECPELS
jgi:hypothetical protein